MLNEVLGRVDVNRMSRDLFHTCSTPLPFRKVNHTVSGHEKCTLDEMDDFLQGELESIGLTVERAPFQIQALRCDSTKPLHHWYSKPMPEDPFHTACNLEVALPGREFPEEIIQLVSHKDSMSWIDSP
ncbi:MAG: hypothetical protein KAI66_05460, partial [Lentisphaeria bacterium]|nr:hypothetical protein [Lentisphaeria bacterium]